MDFEHGSEKRFSFKTTEMYNETENLSRLCEIIQTRKLST